MAKLVDIEAEIPIKYVQLEGLVCIRPLVILINIKLDPIGRLKNRQA